MGDVGLVVGVGGGGWEGDGVGVVGEWGRWGGVGGGCCVEGGPGRPPAVE